MGFFCKAKKKLIDDKKHKILESGHLLLLVQIGAMVWQQHFSLCNEHLKKLEKKRLIGLYEI